MGALDGDELEFSASIPSPQTVGVVRLLDVGPGLALFALDGFSAYLAIRVWPELIRQLYPQLRRQRIWHGASHYPVRRRS